MAVVKTLDQIVRVGLLDDDERTGIAVDVAKEVEAELRAGPAILADKLSDDFVNFNFNQTWRRGIPKGAVFGVDYDYFTAVVARARVLLNEWLGGDPDPDWKGRQWYGSAPRGYAASFRLWQNEKPVPWGAPLEGPQVDIGPTVDFGLFLERWNTGNGPNLPLFESIGILQAMARQLQREWEGVHHIYAMVRKPNERTGVAVREKRKEPVEKFPIIRIQTRHR